MSYIKMTSKGYIRRTPEEIRESIIKKQKELNPDFEKLDLDVQANLIDTGVAKISEYENLVEALFNAYSLDGSNEFFFKQMGEELGLRMKNAYNAQVTLQFKGLPGDIIPPYTKVKDASGKFQFETQRRDVIDSTGIVNIEAYGEADLVCPANSLKFLVSILSDGISVNNPQPSMEKVEKESFAEFKARAQARLRSPRIGGRLYAESLVKSIDGVDPRLVAFDAIDENLEYDPERPLLYQPPKTDPDEKPPVKPENELIPPTIIDEIRLVNEGEVRPDITTLQEYVEAKWALGQFLVDKEFVHLFNKTGLNNYIYWDQRWYEVKFRLKSNQTGGYITAISTGKNIEALEWDQLPAQGTNDVIIFCNKPGDKVGFYKQQDEIYECFLGQEVVIDETNKPKVFNFINVVGIEAVVGGGDSYKIALALYQSFFETQKLFSNPSNKETDRTVSVSLGLYNNTFPIVFTRPKLLELNLKLELATLYKSMSALAVQKATEKYLVPAINSLRVGRPVVMNQLNQIIAPGFLDIDLQPYEIKATKWKYDIGQFKDRDDKTATDSELVHWKDFDTDSKIPVIFFDCYCVLVRYEVEIIGG